MKKYDILLDVALKNIKFLSFSLIVCSLLVLSGCWSSSNNQSKLIIINVLDPDYYQDCHIPGSINIPFEKFEDRMKTLNKKDFQWYVYILPYLNLSLDEKKYNTPLSTEVFYKDNLSLVLDGYKNGVFPSLRWRVKIL